MVDAAADCVAITGVDQDKVLLVLHRALADVLRRADGHLVGPVSENTDLVFRSPLTGNVAISGHPKSTEIDIQVSAEAICPRPCVATIRCTLIYPLD